MKKSAHYSALWEVAWLDSCSENRSLKIMSNGLLLNPYAIFGTYLLQYLDNAIYNVNFTIAMIGIVKNSDHVWNLNKGT